MQALAEVDDMHRGVRDGNKAGLKSIAESEANFNSTFGLLSGGGKEEARYAWFCVGLLIG